MSKKIIFFGTPSFAVKCLEKMVDESGVMKIKH